MSKNFKVKNGLEVNHITSSGNISSSGYVSASSAIATVGPSYQTTIHHGNTGGPTIKFGTPTTVGSFMTIGAFGGINNLDTEARDFHLFGSNTTTGFYFDESHGKFGIGTTVSNVNKTLTVVGDISASGDLYLKANGSLYLNAPTTGDNYIQYDDTNDHIKIVSQDIWLSPANGVGVGGGGDNPGSFFISPGGSKLTTAHLIAISGSQPGEIHISNTDLGGAVGTDTVSGSSVGAIAFSGRTEHYDGVNYKPYGYDNYDGGGSGISAHEATRLIAHIRAGADVDQIFPDKLDLGGMRTATGGFLSFHTSQDSRSYAPGAGAQGLSEGEAMRIDRKKQVGIGFQKMNYRLVVKDSTAISASLFHQDNLGGARLILKGLRSGSGVSMNPIDGLQNPTLLPGFALTQIRSGIPLDTDADGDGNQDIMGASGSFEIRPFRPSFGLDLDIGGVIADNMGTIPENSFPAFHIRTYDRPHEVYVQQMEEDGVVGPHHKGANFGFNTNNPDGFNVNVYKSTFGSNTMDETVMDFRGLARFRHENQQNPGVFEYLGPNGAGPEDDIITYAYDNISPENGENNEISADISVNPPNDELMYQFFNPDETSPHPTPAQIRFSWNWAFDDTLSFGIQEGYVKYSATGSIVSGAMAFGSDGTDPGLYNVSRSIWSASVGAFNSAAPFQYTLEDLFGDGDASFVTATYTTQVSASQPTNPLPTEFPTWPDNGSYLNTRERYKWKVELNKNGGSLAALYPSNIVATSSAFFEFNGPYDDTANQMGDGDVNFDDIINVTDLVSIISHILSDNGTLTDEQIAAADVNGDGIINVQDVVALVNIILEVNNISLQNARNLRIDVPGNHVYQSKLIENNILNTLHSELSSSGVNVLSNTLGNATENSSSLRSFITSSMTFLQSGSALTSVKSAKYQYKKNKIKPLLSGSDSGYNFIEPLSCSLSGSLNSLNGVVEGSTLLFDNSYLRTVEEVFINDLGSVKYVRLNAPIQSGSISGSFYKEFKPQGIGLTHKPVYLSSRRKPIRKNRGIIYRQGDGRVGIGTSRPEAILHISASNTGSANKENSVLFKLERPDGSEYKVTDSEIKYQDKRGNVSRRKFNSKGQEVFISGSKDTTDSDSNTIIFDQTGNKGMITISGSQGSSPVLNLTTVADNGIHNVLSQISKTGIKFINASFNTPQSFAMSFVEPGDLILSTGASVDSTRGILISGSGNLGIGLARSSKLDSKLALGGNLFVSGSNGHITSSGNISSSGTITMLTASIGGGIFTSASLAAGGGGGGGSDNLGNHTATQDLDLDGNSIKAALHITASGNISASNASGEHFFGGITKIDKLVVNESGASNHDFRVEGGTDNYLLMVDASEDKVSISRNIIGLGAAKSKFQVGGDVTIDSHITASGNISASYSSTIDGNLYQSHQKRVADYHSPTDAVRLGDSATNLNLQGHSITLKSPLTSSYNISSSATINANEYKLDGATEFYVNGVNPSSTVQGRFSVSFPNTSGIKDLYNLGISGNPKFNHITASGDISSSGHIMSTAYKLKSPSGGDEISALYPSGNDISVGDPGMDDPLVLLGNQTFINIGKGTAGRVGIGDNTPVSFVDIAGDLNVQSHITASGNISSSGTGTNYFGGGLNINGTTTFNDGNITNVGTIDVDRIRADADSDVYIDVTTSGIDFTAVGSDGFIFNGDGGARLEYNNTEGTIFYIDDGTDRIGIGVNGNYGTSRIPAKTLTVAGDISASGNFYLQRSASIGDTNATPPMHGLYVSGSISSSGNLHSFGGNVGIGTNAINDADLIINSTEINAPTPGVTLFASTNASTHGLIISGGQAGGNASGYIDTLQHNSLILKAAGSTYVRLNSNRVHLDKDTKVTGHITASGYISASSGVETDLLFSPTGTNLSVNAFGNLTLQGTNGTVTLDSAQDIALSADGDQITMDDGTTTRFTFNVDSTPEIDVAGDLIIDPSGNNTKFDSHITASGNISASNDIKASSYKIQGNSFGSFGSGIITLASTVKKTQINGTNIKLNAPVTASGNISASSTTGTHTFGGQTTVNQITASALNLEGTGAAELEVDGHITATHLTASGNISGSSTSRITANEFYAKTRYGFQGTDSQIRITGDTINIAPGDSETIDVNDHRTKFTGHITASGNISSSGNLIISTVNAYNGINSNNWNAIGNSVTIGHPTKVMSHITASGNISSSGHIEGSSLGANSLQVGSTGIAFSTNFVSNTMKYNSSLGVLALGGNTSVSGHITASGNISGSSTSTGSFGHLEIDGAGDALLGVDGNISASGGISSSRLVIVKKDASANEVLFSIRNATSRRFSIDEDGDVESSAGITAGGQISGYGIVSFEDVTAQKNIDANGNISASGYLALTGSGEIYGSGSYLTIANDETNPSELRLNCENNSHYIGIRGPVHSGASSYVLKLPNSAPSDNQILKVDGSPSAGEVTLAWESDGGGGGGVSFPTTEVVSSSADLFIGKTDAPYISGSQGNLELSGSGAVSELEVDHRHFDTGSATVGSAGGAIGDTIKFGDSSGLTPGKCYYLQSDGTWEATDADFGGKTSGSIAVATNAAATNGMVLRGVVKLSHDPGGNPGAPLYISTDAGELTSTVPGSGDFVRVVGYNLDSSGLIFFNPGDTTLKVS